MFSYVNNDVGYNLVAFFLSDEDVVADLDLYHLSSHIPRSSIVSFFVSEFEYNSVEVKNKLDHISEKLDTRKVFKLWNEETKTVEDLESLINKKKTEKTHRIIRTVERTLLRKCR